MLPEKRFCHVVSSIVLMYILSVSGRANLMSQKKIMIHMVGVEQELDMLKVFYVSNRLFVNVFYSKMKLAPKVYLLPRIIVK